MRLPLLAFLLGLAWPSHAANLYYRAKLKDHDVTSGCLVEYGLEWETNDRKKSAAWILRAKTNISEFTLWETGLPAGGYAYPIPVPYFFKVRFLNTNSIWDSDNKDSNVVRTKYRICYCPPDDRKEQ